MNWRNFFLTLIRNVLLVSLGAALVLGILFGLLGGWVGFQNGLAWGFTLGIFSTPFVILPLIYAKYGGDYAGRFGSWYVKKQTEGDDTTDDYGNPKPR